VASKKRTIAELAREAADKIDLLRVAVTDENRKKLARHASRAAMLCDMLVERASDAGQIPALVCNKAGGLSEIIKRMKTDAAHNDPGEKFLEWGEYAEIDEFVAFARRHYGSVKQPKVPAL
jgi:hypothetical protein